MKMTIHPDIIEATRLTREGKLVEATALLQNLLMPSEKLPNSDVGGANEDARDLSRTAEVTEGLAERGTPRSEAQMSLRSMKHDAEAGRTRRRMLRAVRGVIDKARKSRAKSPDQGPGHAIPSDLAPKSGRFLTASYAGHAGSRTYKLYIPSAYRGKPLPLIVMLHGCTQSADDFAAGTRMNFIGDERACFVAYPEQSKSANPSKCWNWFSPRHQHRGRGEPSIIAGITREIMRDYAIDKRRVYIAGLSAGGAAAVILGATYPDIYAAVGVHSGLPRGAANNVPSAFSAMKHARTQSSHRQPLSPELAGNRTFVPTIIFHGDDDKTVHPRNSEHIVEQLQLDGAADFRPEIHYGQVESGHSYTRTNYFEASGQTALELWVIHNADHAWSGGNPDGSYTDPQGPDASREMIRFFLDHPQEDAA